MAEFEMTCPNCHTKLAAEEEWIGMNVECPVCRKNVLVGKAASPGDAPLETEAQRHLQYAFMAMKNGAFPEAKKEFELVLNGERDDVQALYGMMVCDAYMSTPEQSKLESIVYQYKKIELIIREGRGASWSCEELKRHFISDVGAFVVRSFRNIVSTLRKLRDDAKTRDAINAINVLSHKILLSNPEAAAAKAKGEFYLPYLVQLQRIRIFILSLVDMDTVGEEPEVFALVKQIFEATPDISKEDQETLDNYGKICRTHEIRTIAEARQCSFQEAEAEYERRHAPTPAQVKFNALAAKHPSPVWLLFALLCFFGFPAINFAIVYLLSEADARVSLRIFPFVVIPLGFVSFFLGMYLSFLSFTAWRLERREGREAAFFRNLRTGWNFFKRYWLVLTAGIVFVAVFIPCAITDSISAALITAVIATPVLSFLIWFFVVALRVIVLSFKD